MVTLQTMYAGIVNSPITEISGAIDNVQTSIPLLDASALPSAPNLATIGAGDIAETILYAGKTGDTLTGVTRGFQGDARSWGANVKVSRNFTEYDYETLRSNISDTADEIGNKATLLTTNKTTVVAAVNELFTSASNGKSAVAAAITGMGVAATGADTYAQLATKIADISDDATATTAQVLAGSTFYQGGVKRTGAMVNNGAGGNVTPSTTNIVKAAGFYSSAITILGSADGIAANIRIGKMINGILGTMPEGTIMAMGVSSGSIGYRLITGLAFKPIIIIARLKPNSDPKWGVQVYVEANAFSGSNVSEANVLSNGGGSGLTGGAFTEITNGSFKHYADFSSDYVYWAFG